MDLATILQGAKGLKGTARDAYLLIMGATFKAEVIAEFEAAEREQSREARAISAGLHQANAVIATLMDEVLRQRGDLD